MGYHTLSIRPDNTYTQESMERDTILKSVSLTPYVDESEKRTSLKLQIDDQKEITLCSLLVNSCESKVLNMPIKRGSKVSFEVEGKNDIDLLLYELEPEEEEGDEEGAYITRRIEGNERITIQENVPIRIINASLAKGNIAQERTVLFLQKEEGDVPLVTFLAGKHETESIDIDLPQEEEISLGVKGSNAVDVLIYYTMLPEDYSTTEEYTEEEGPSNDFPNREEEQKEEEAPHQEEKKTQKPSKETKEEPKEKPTNEERENRKEEKEGRRKEQKAEKRKRCSDSSQEQEEVPLKRIQMVPGEEKKDAFSSISSEQEDPVVLISEGVGKVLGRRSVVSCNYSLLENGKKEEHQEEVFIRKMPHHPVLKSFFPAVVRSREGAVFKSYIKKNTENIECVLRIGKITRSLCPDNSEDSS